MVAGGLGLQVLIAACILKAPFLARPVSGLKRPGHGHGHGHPGRHGFVFGYVGGGPAPFAATQPGNAFILGFQSLPLVIVVAA